MQCRNLIRRHLVLNLRCKGSPTIKNPTYNRRFLKSGSLLCNSSHWGELDVQAIFTFLEGFMG